jgi:hypothetical protein
MTQTKKVIVVKKSDRDYYYTHTNYPKIFNQTYWGAFDNSKNKLEEEIIENRNKFIRTYNIKDIKSKSKVPAYINKFIDRNAYPFLDHTEVYITKDNNYVAISSPYADINSEHIENGWTEIHALYNTSAKTFIKLIPMRTKVIVMSP